MNIEDIANEVLKIIRQNGVKIEDAIVLNNPDSAKELLTLTDSGDIAKISPETLLSTVLNRGMVYNGYIAEGVTIPIIENSFYLLTKEGQYTDSDGNTITIASKGLNLLTRRNNEWKVYAICRLHDSITSTDADAYLSARAGNELYEKIKVLENNSGGGGSITVDSALSTTSENPVQNKAITTSINAIINGTTPVAKANVLNTSTKIGVGEAVSSTPKVYTGKNDIVIPITTLREAYLQWGGKVIISGLSPIDAAMDSEFSSNRLSFLPAEYINVEYSNDGGTTWIDYGLSNEDKQKLITSGFGTSIYLGKKSNSQTIDDKLRVTLTFPDGYLYFSSTKLLIYASGINSVNEGYKCNIEKLLCSYDSVSEDEKVFSTVTTAVIAGFGGWNSIPLSLAIGAQTNREGTNMTRKLRMTFFTDATSTVRSPRIIYIRLFGPTIYANNIGYLSKNNHMYTWDINKNVTFPANVSATNFVGKWEGNTVDSMTSLALRKLFLAEGALYNDTDAIIKRTASWGTEEKWQQEEDGSYTYWEEDALIDHLPKHYYLNGLGNITESEMIKIYAYKDAVTRFHYPRCCQGTSIRTFFGMWHQHGISSLQAMSYCTFFYNGLLESALWYSKSLEGGYDNSVRASQVTAPTEMSYTFNQCSKLKYIYPINVKNTTKPFATTFGGCTSLKEIRLHNLKSNLILSSSSEISKRSILHAIKNASPTTAITITLHPDAYARIESQPDIIEALREKNGYVDEEGNEVAGTLPAGASINLVSA